jgi:hypothetical protein
MALEFLAEFIDVALSLQDDEGEKRVANSSTGGDAPRCM